MDMGEAIHLRRLTPLLPGLTGLALLALAAFYSQLTLRQVVDYTDARKAMRENVVRAEHVLSLLKDVETGSRGYLLSDDPVYLEPYRRALRELPPLRRELRRELTLAGLPAAELAALDSLMDQRLALAGARVELMRAGHPAEARAKALGDRGKVAMDRLRAGFDGLEDSLRHRIAVLDERVRTLQRRALVAGVILALAAGGLLILAYTLLLREQGRRVRAEQQRGEAVLAQTVAREQAETQRHIVNILESLVDGFVALDRDWHYLYVNAQGGRLLGRAPDELIGRHIWTEFPEGERQPFAQAYRRVMDTRRAEVIEDYYAPWGRWFENRIYPTPEGIAIYFHEITDRKRAEAEARRRGAELESVFQALPDLYFRLGADGTILDYLARHDALYVPPEVFLGKRMQDVLPGDVGVLFAAKLDEAPGADGVVGFEYTLPMADSERQFEARLMRLPETDERAVVVRDITLRKRDEAALRQARDDLRAFAARLDRDIETERRRLAREVHDQIGQIFTALKLNLLACSPGAPLHADSVGEFGNLLDQGIRVARRIAADLRPPMLDDLGLGPALAHHARRIGEQAGFTVEVEVRDDTCLAPAQANQLFRIAQEALTNVARHARASRVRIVGGAEHGHYLLRIEDDGRGLPADFAAGLGMLGMRERAELINARLSAAASELGGTRLTVHLPLGEGEE